jgi:hypothetical protein
VDNPYAEVVLIFLGTVFALVGLLLLLTAFM